SGKDLPIGNSPGQDPFESRLRTNRYLLERSPYYFRDSEGCPVKGSQQSVLGISAYYHDSAACLVQDGMPVAAAQEERFTRKKHAPGFPAHAISYCLEEGGVRLDELSSIVFYDKPFLTFDRLMETYLGFAPRGLRSFIMAMPLWLKEKLFLRETLEKELKKRF